MSQKLLFLTFLIFWTFKWINTPHFKHLVTTESSSHDLIIFSDKLCDQISDAVVDAHLQQDPNAKVSCGKLEYVSYFVYPHLV